MLNWLFKKRGAGAPPAADRPRAVPPPAARTPPAADPVDWAARLAAAHGDDSALLQLALSAPRLQQRLDAAEAIHGEAGLRLAEREFRKRDRKLHSRIKQRLDALVSQRAARGTAEQLLARAQALADQEILPVNQLLALDKAWAALPPAALEPAQAQAYTALRAQLDAQVRERGEARQRRERWTTAVQAQLHAGPAQLRSLAAEGRAADAAALTATLGGWRDRRPADTAVDDTDRALTALWLAAQRVEQGLQRLEAEAEPDAGDPQDTSDATSDALQHSLLRLIDERRARQQPPAPVEVAPPPAPEPAATPQHHDAAVTRTAGSAGPTPEQRLQLEQLLQAGEVAVAEGRTAALPPPLQALERLLGDAGLALPADLRERHQALRNEQRRLQDWQRWGGARARDELVAQAEVLARSCATEPRPPDEPGPRRPAPLKLKQHADQIQTLRQQWKQLDRQGAPASPALWQRFDGALQAAYQPVAAQHLQQQAARQENLATREALLAELEAATPGQPPAEADPAAWRQAGHVLAQFQSAWRKLGPLEHTVPAAAREAVQARLQQALGRIDEPLQRARADAVARREQLIARVEALLQDGNERRGPADPARKLRELQADWTEQARQVVLPRALETGLWARFKAAADAVHGLREQGLAAREAAQAAQRQAELSRLARWAAQCGALGAAVARCEAREDGLADDTLPPPPAEVIPLPPAWSQALAERQAGTSGQTVGDDELLRLEVALDLPSPLGHQAERQQLKLRALKQAMEGRAQPDAPSPGALLLPLLRQTGLRPDQRDRLQAVIAALGARAPGAGGLPAPGP